MFMVPRSSNTGGVGSPEVSELQRRLANIIRRGTVAEVRHDPPAVRVRVGNADDPRGHILTGWLPWAADAGANRREWNPPAQGQPVTILSPGGELTAGIVQPGTFSDGAPAPASSGTVARTVYPDGAVVEYDHEAKRLRIEGVGTVKLVSVGDVEIEAPTVRIRGNVVVEGDVVADGVSLKNHRQGNVQAGSGVSGPPVPG